jgi:hypothetical protein
MEIDGDHLASAALGRQPRGQAGRGQAAAETVSLNAITQTRPRHRVRRDQMSFSIEFARTLTLYSSRHTCPSGRDRAQPLIRIRSLSTFGAPYV